MQDIDWRNAKKAREELGDVISKFLRNVVDKPEKADGSKIALGLKVSAGLGKTDTTLRLIAEHGPSILKRGHILFYVPTHDLADRAAEAFANRRSGIPSFVLRGREADNPKTGQPMCERPELVRKITGRVPSITKALCRVEEDGVAIEAPCANGCPYMRQFEIREHSVIFLAHAYLALPPVVPGPVALRVIDEKFWTTMTGSVEIPLKEWNSEELSGVPSEIQEKHQTVRQTVYAALKDNKPIHLALREQRIERGDLEAISAQSGGATSALPIDPGSSEQEIDKILGQASDAGLGQSQEFTRVFGLLADTFDRETTERLSLVSKKAADAPPEWIKAHFLKELPDDAPALFLDADLDETLVERFHPGAEVFTLLSPPEAWVVQIRDWTMSRNLLTNKSDSEKTRTKLADIIRREVSAADQVGARTLVVATQNTLRALCGDVGATFHDNSAQKQTLHGATIRWFGQKLLGVNDFEDYGTIILIGRLQTDVVTIEDDLRAVFGDSEDPLKFAQEDRLVQSDRQIFIRTGDDGRTRPDWEVKILPVQIHPDPRGDTLLRQNREAHSSQAIARLRLISPKRPKRVVNICNIPLPGLPVDELVSFEELWRGTPDHYEKLKKAIVNAGSLPLEGLRISGVGLVEDASHTFRSKSSGKEFRRKISADTALLALRQVASDLKMAATPVSLSNPSGGRRPTLAVVFAHEANALQKAESLWPGFTYSHIDWPADAIQTPPEVDSEAVLEAV